MTALTEPMVRALEMLEQAGGTMSLFSWRYVGRVHWATENALAVRGHTLYAGGMKITLAGRAALAKWRATHADEATS